MLKTKAQVIFLFEVSSATLLLEEERCLLESKMGKKPHAIRCKQLSLYSEPGLCRVNRLVQAISQ